MFGTFKYKCCVCGRITSQVLSLHNVMFSEEQCQVSAFLVTGTYEGLLSQSESSWSMWRLTMRIGGGDHRKFMVSGTVYLMYLVVNLALARFWMNMRKLSWLSMSMQSWLEYFMYHT